MKHQSEEKKIGKLEQIDEQIFQWFSFIQPTTAKCRASAGARKPLHAGGPHEEFGSLLRFALSLRAWLDRLRGSGVLGASPDYAGARRMK